MIGWFESGHTLDMPVDVGKLQELDYQPDIIQAVGGQKAWREWKFSE